MGSLDRASLACVRTFRHFSVQTPRFSSYTPRVNIICNLTAISIIAITFLSC